jgi:hypothetical protein
MNKKYEAIMLSDGSWAVDCEHIDEDFRVELICKCNDNNKANGEIWAQRIANALNQMEIES